jgi:hypothetical protein
VGEYARLNELLVDWIRDLSPLLDAAVAAGPWFKSAAVAVSRDRCRVAAVPELTSLALLLVRLRRDGPAPVAKQRGHVRSEGEGEEENIGFGLRSGTEAQMEGGTNPLTHWAVHKRVVVACGGMAAARTSQRSLQAIIQKRSRTRKS